MPPAKKQPIIDSHIHLWPLADANPENHAWMSSVPPLLNKQHSVSDYLKATYLDPSSDVRGFVFIEVDRNHGSSASRVEDWAWGPLKELRFLRRLVEGQWSSEEGFGEGDCGLVKGIVAWAPVNRGIEGFRKYLEIAERVAGANTWNKVKGFRFLLQGIRKKRDFKALTDSTEFVDVLRNGFGGRWVFDVGVDERQGGVWQLEEVVNVVRRVHEGLPKEDKVVFVLNHLCKPDMRQHPTTLEQKKNFERWKAAMQQFARFEKVYIKLSGGFSEMGSQQVEDPMPVAEIVKRMKPWVDVLIKHFTPQRIMFGSDWPVCNVGGPGGELSWKLWKDAVAAAIEEYGLSSEEKDRIWFGTAVEAYKLDPITR